MCCLNNSLWVTFWLLWMASLGGPGGETSLFTPAQAASPVVAIRGATLIDGTERRPLEAVTILLEEQRIRQIGLEGEVRIPADTQVISAQGKYVIPGLIDAHVHYNQPFLHLLYLANGVTTVRDLGSPTEAIIRLRAEISAGNLLAPRLLVSGTPINELSIKASGEMSAKAMAQSLVEAGVDGIKVTDYTFEDLKAIVTVAHENGLTVYGHTRLLPGADKAIEAGLDGIEHVTGVLEHAIEENPPFPADFDWSSRDHFFRFFYGQLYAVVSLAKVDKLIQKMVENDVYLAPTLINHYRGFVKRSTNELAADPALRYMPKKGDRPDRYGRYGEEDRENWRQTFKLMQEATYRFHKAGGLISLGTDSQAAAPDGALPGWSLHQEMELFVQAGLTPMEAIQTATINNARVLQRERQLGTVEVGKYADLVILNANPLEEITNSQKIHLVILGGRVLDPKVLLQQHLERFGERQR